MVAIQSALPSPKDWASHTGALAGYTFLTALLTHPIAFRLHEGLWMFPFDGFEFYWNLWWMKRALTELWQFPLYTRQIFFPEGVSLASHTLVPFAGVASIPLQALFGLKVTINLLILLGFVFSGYTAFLLARHLIGSPVASFLAGMVFTFAPFHFMHARHHLNLTMMIFPPLYVLACARFWEDLRLRRALAAALWLVLTGLCDWNYFLFLVLGTAAALIYAALVHPQSMTRPELWKGLGLMSVAAAMALPFVLPLAREVLANRIQLDAGGGVRGNSADLAAFFVPSDLHRLWREEPWLRLLYKRFWAGETERTVSLGYTAMALGALGVRWTGRRRAGVWLMLLVLFFILALGPTLQVLGTHTFTFIRLPYKWLIQDVPLLNGARVPARFSLGVMLALSVLAGMGLKELLLRCRPWNRSLVAGVASALLLFEFWPAPFQLEKISLPKPYVPLSEMNEDFALLEVPVGLPQNTRKYILYQTWHGRPIVSGLVSRVPRTAWRFIYEDPFVRRLHLPELIGEDDGKTTTEGLIKHKIKFILVHNNQIFYEQGGSPPDHLNHLLARQVHGLRRSEILKSLHAFLSRRTKRLDISDPDITVYQVY